jgi:hypothetical protein
VAGNILPSGPSAWVASSGGLPSSKAASPRSAALKRIKGFFGALPTQKPRWTLDRRGGLGTPPVNEYMEFVI